MSALIILIDLEIVDISVNTHFFYIAGYIRCDSLVYLINEQKESSNGLN